MHARALAARPPVELFYKYEELPPSFVTICRNLFLRLLVKPKANPGAADARFPPLIQYAPFTSPRLAQRALEESTSLRAPRCPAAIDPDALVT